MIPITIPGRGNYTIAHLVLDLNGTLALDGFLLPGIAEQITQLASLLTIHILTSDTHGSAAEQLAGLPIEIEILCSPDHSREKANYVRKLGFEKTIAIGNGANDARMLENAAIGIAVIQREGGAAKTIVCADVVFSDILHAFEAILNPLRLIATLRE